MIANPANDWVGTVGALPEITKLSFEIMALNEDGTLSDDVLDAEVDPTPLNADNNFRYSNTLTFADGATAELSVDFGDLDLQHLDTTGTVYAAGTACDRIVSTPLEETAIGFTTIRYRTQAARALDVVQNRIDALSEVQGRYGAVQSRLESRQNALAVFADTIADAESRIRDADVAFETAQYVRLGILQKAAAGILAQANQQPALVVQLLRG